MLIHNSCPALPPMEGVLVGKRMKLRSFSSLFLEQIPPHWGGERSLCLRPWGQVPEKDLPGLVPGCMEGAQGRTEPVKAKHVASPCFPQPGTKSPNPLLRDALRAKICKKR